MMSPHDPRGRMGAASSQVCDAGVDMIPVKLCVAASPQARLDVGVELAEIVKHGSVDDDPCQAVADCCIVMVSQHRFSALAGAVHDAANMFGVELRLAARQAGRVRERLHGLGRGGDRPFLEAQILEGGEPRAQVVRKFCRNIVVLDAA